MTTIEDPYTAPSLPDDEIIRLDQLAAISSELWGEPHYGRSVLALLGIKVINAELQYPPFDADILALSRIYDCSSGLVEIGEELPRQQVEARARQAWEAEALPYEMEPVWTPVEPPYWHFSVHAGPLSRSAVGAMLASRRPGSFLVPSTVSKGLQVFAVAAGLKRPEQIDPSAFEPSGPFINYGVFVEFIQSCCKPGTQDRLFYELLGNLIGQAEGSYMIGTDNQFVVEGAISLTVPSEVDSVAQVEWEAFSLERIALQSARRLIDRL